MGPQVTLQLSQRPPPRFRVDVRRSLGAPPCPAATFAVACRGLHTSRRRSFRATERRCCEQCPSIVRLAQRSRISSRRPSTLPIICRSERSSRGRVRQTTRWRAPDARRGSSSLWRTYRRSAALPSSRLRSGATKANQGVAGNARERGDAQAHSQAHRRTRGRSSRCPGPQHARAVRRT